MKFFVCFVFANLQKSYIKQKNWDLEFVFFQSLDLLC